MWLNITPLNVTLVRDAKPFTAGEDTPVPTASFRQHQCRWPERSNPSSSLNFSVGVQTPRGSQLPCQ